MAKMTCEDFEGFSLERRPEHTLLSVADAARRAAALEHMNHCRRCAALQEAWRAAQIELQGLRAATQAAETPSRVEMRLRLQFRTKHRTLKMRRAVVAAAWTAAAAAVLASVMAWWNWRSTKLERVPQVVTDVPKTSSPVNRSVGSSNTNTVAVVKQSAKHDALPVAGDAGGYTLLPGSLPQHTDDAALVRVRLQRGTLVALGLPVSEDHAGDWIQVDLLVGEDGQPQAVRLAR
jgi:hypothetical protein